MRVCHYCGRSEAAHVVERRRVHGELVAVVVCDSIPTGEHLSPDECFVERPQTYRLRVHGPSVVMGGR